MTAVVNTTVGIIAGIDGATDPPCDRPLAEREGWIWIRDTAA